MTRREQVSRHRAGVVYREDRVWGHQGEEPLECRPVERRVVRRIEKDEIGPPSVEVFARDRVL